MGKPRATSKDDADLGSCSSFTDAQGLSAICSFTGDPKARYWPPRNLGFRRADNPRDSLGCGGRDVPFGKAATRQLECFSIGERPAAIVESRSIPGSVVRLAVPRKTSNLARASGSGVLELPPFDPSLLNEYASQPFGSVKQAQDTIYLVLAPRIASSEVRFAEGHLLSLADTLPSGSEAAKSLAQHASALAKAWGGLWFPDGYIPDRMPDNASRLAKWRSELDNSKVEANKVIQPIRDYVSSLQAQDPNLSDDLDSRKREILSLLAPRVKPGSVEVGAALLARLAMQLHALGARRTDAEVQPVAHEIMNAARDLAERATMLSAMPSNDRLLRLEAKEARVNAGAFVTAILDFVSKISAEHQVSF